MSHRDNIYVVDVTRATIAGATTVTTVTRLVIIGESTEQAARIATKVTWSSEVVPPGSEVEVGRLGYYDPGIGGAHMTPGRIVSMGARG